MYRYIWPAFLVGIYDATKPPRLRRRGFVAQPSANFAPVLLV